MKQFIELVMRDRAFNITLPMEKALKVLESPQQIVMLYDENGKWTGDTINKSEIVATHHNIEIERDEREKELKKNALNAPEEKKLPPEKMREKLDKYKPDFLQYAEK